MTEYNELLVVLELKAAEMIKNSKLVLDEYRGYCANKFDAELNIQRNLPALYALSKIKGVQDD